jgi:hypothetical protein
MTHVNLDTQPEMVRQLVLALSASGEGAALESAGRPVAWVVPPPRPGEAGAPEGEWAEEKNRRRCELIGRKYDHGLGPADEAELALPQHALHRRSMNARSLQRRRAGATDFLRPRGAPPEDTPPEFTHSGAQSGAGRGL